MAFPAKPARPRSSIPARTATRAFENPGISTSRTKLLRLRTVTEHGVRQCQPVDERTAAPLGTEWISNNSDPPRVTDAHALMASKETATAAARILSVLFDRELIPYMVARTRGFDCVTEHHASRLNGRDLHDFESARHEFAPHQVIGNI